MTFIYQIPDFDFVYMWTNKNERNWKLTLSLFHFNLRKRKENNENSNIRIYSRATPHILSWKSSLMVSKSTWTFTHEEIRNMTSIISSRPISNLKCTINRQSHSPERYTEERGPHLSQLRARWYRKLYQKRLS